MEIIYPPFIAPVYPRPNVDRPSEELPRGAEMLPLVQQHGMATGRMTREYAHGGEKPLHPVVHLHLVNRRGAIYLQKRAMTKDLLPGYWDTAVGGHVSYGEQISEALFREASEELGLEEFNPVGICSYVFERQVQKELVHLFAAIGELQPRPDGEEVSEGRWWTPAEIEEAMGRSVLTPNFEGEYARIHSQLEALL